MVGARRLETLRQLGVKPGEARTVEAACKGAAEVLADNPHDIPFAAIYLVDESSPQVGLSALAGLCGDTWPMPATVSLADPEGWAPLLAEVLHTQRAPKFPTLAHSIAGLVALGPSL